MDPTQSLLQRIAIALEQIRIESLPLLQRIAIALEKRATPSESLGSTAGGPDVDVDRIVDQLVGRFDLQPRGPELLLNVSWLAGLIRRLGYPVTSVPPFVTGSYVDAWQDPTLDPVVRAVSVRLYARTAMPLPTPEQYRLRVRALDGALADIDREQQIRSPDGQSHHRGRPADEDRVTFRCWFWRRSKQLYQRKGAVQQLAHGESGANVDDLDSRTSGAAKKKRAASTRRRANTKRRPGQRHRTTGQGR